MSVLGPPSFSSGMRELQRHGKVFQLWLVTVSLNYSGVFGDIARRNCIPSADVLT